MTRGFAWGIAIELIMIIVLYTEYKALEMIF